MGVCHSNSSKIAAIEDEDDNAPAEALRAISYAKLQLDLSQPDRRSGVAGAWPALMQVPKAVFAVTGLRVLSLKRNRLGSLPADIIQLQALVELDLSENPELDCLPDEIGGLLSLESLDISECRFKALPPALGKLARLARLIAYKNQISAVPDELQACTALREVRCRGARVDGAASACVCPQPLL
jgi:hypothetical protein